MLLTYMCLPANKFVPHNDLFPRAVFLSSLVFTILNNSPSMMLYFKFFYAVWQYICCIKNPYNLQNTFLVSAHLPLDTSLPPTLIHQMSGLPFSPTQQCQPHPWYHHSFVSNDTNNLRYLTKYESWQGLLTKSWTNVTLPFIPPEELCYDNNQQRLQ